MRLPVPFIQLPLRFDAAALAAEIRALGEAAWMPHPEGFAGNSALPLISANGDPASNAITGPMRPTPLLERCPLMLHTLATIGAVWGRSRLMRLSGNAEVTAHVDTNYYWRERMRVHVPIVTQPTVRFICGEAELNMRPGECWILQLNRSSACNPTDVRLGVRWDIHGKLNAIQTARRHYWCGIRRSGSGQASGQARCLCDGD